jgi:hypothetical protein
MTSIRIAIAAAVMFAAAFAGGAGLATHRQAPAIAQAASLSGASLHHDPVLCC